MSTSDCHGEGSGWKLLKNMESQVSYFILLGELVTSFPKLGYNQFRFGLFGFLRCQKQTERVDSRPVIQGSCFTYLKGLFTNFMDRHTNDSRPSIHCIILRFSGTRNLSHFKLIVCYGYCGVYAAFRTLQQNRIPIRMNWGSLFSA